MQRSARVRSHSAPVTDSLHALHALRPRAAPLCEVRASQSDRVSSVSAPRTPSARVQEEAKLRVKGLQHEAARQEQYEAAQMALWAEYAAGRRPVSDTLLCNRVTVLQRLGAGGEGRVDLVRVRREDGSDVRCARKVRVPQRRSLTMAGATRHVGPRPPWPTPPHTRIYAASRGAFRLRTCSLHVHTALQANVSCAVGVLTCTRPAGRAWPHARCSAAQLWKLRLNAGH